MTSKWELVSLIFLVLDTDEFRADLFIFFFNDTATTEIYTLSLHALFRSHRWEDVVGELGPPADHAVSDDRWDRKEQGRREHLAPRLDHRGGEVPQQVAGDGCAAAAARPGQSVVSGAHHPLEILDDARVDPVGPG